MHIELPYGKGTLPLDVPEKNLLEVAVPKEFIQSQEPELMIKDALQHPLGTDPLSTMIRPGETVAIVIDDYTRPCPTKSILPPVLEELKQAGVNDLDVLIIIATGTHCPPTADVIKDIVGDKIFRNYMISSNDAVNGTSMLILRFSSAISNTIILPGSGGHERASCRGFPRKIRFNGTIACCLRNIPAWVS